MNYYRRPNYAAFVLMAAGLVLLTAGCLWLGLGVSRRLTALDERLSKNNEQQDEMTRRLEAVVYKLGAVISTQAQATPRVLSASDFTPQAGNALLSEPQAVLGTPCPTPMATPMPVSTLLPVSTPLPTAAETVEVTPLTQAADEGVTVALGEDGTRWMAADDNASTGIELQAADDEPQPTPKPKAKSRRSRRRR